MAASKGRKGGSPIDRTSISGDGLLDLIPLRAVILDMEGRIVGINSHASEPEGPGHGWTVGSHVFDHIGPSGIGDLLEALKGSQAGVRKVRIEVDVPGKGPMPTEMSLSTAGSPDRIICAMVPSPTDAISRFEGLLDSLEVPADIVNRGLKVLEGNEPFTEQIRFLGRKKVAKDAIASREAFLKERFRTGRGGELTLEVTQRGRKNTYLLLVSPIQGGENMLEVWLDLTSMEGLNGPSVNDPILEEMLDTSNAMIIGLDMEGTVILYNKGAHKALGYHRDEIIGRSWFNYMLEPSSGRGVLEVFQWNINTGFKTRFENRIRSSSGDLITVSWENTVLFDRAGNVNMILMVGQDITKMKVLEDSLIARSEELERALEETSIYNDLMLHDIHNSTAAIMGYLELMGLKNIPAEKRSDYQSRALLEIKKSAAVIKEVRMLSRLEPAIEPAKVNLPEAFPRMKEIQRAGTIIIEEDLTDLQVYADPYLEDAVLRIIDHISRIGNDGTVIQIKARRAPSMSKKLKQPVLITITGNGVRFPLDLAETLFKHQPKRGSTSQKLGLYLVKRIMERSGGMIWLDEDRNGSVRFNMLLREVV